LLVILLGLFPGILLDLARSSVLALL